MRTKYYTATNLDGFIATEEDSFEWLFPLGGIGATGYPEFIAGVGRWRWGRRRTSGCHATPLETTSVD